VKKAKPPKDTKAALVALRDELQRIAADLAPVPASAEGYFLPVDFRGLSLTLPTPAVYDSAIQSLDGQDREELTRRVERLENDWTAFLTHRRRWRNEVADSVRAMRGEMGELSDPAGKLATFTRNLNGDLDHLNGLLKAKPTKRERPRYPQGGDALRVLAEAARRKAEPKYHGATNQEIALSLLLQENSEDWWRTMLKPKGKLSAPRRDLAKHNRSTLFVVQAAKNWGGYLSAYLKDHPNP